MCRLRGWPRNQRGGVAGRLGIRSRWCSEFIDGDRTRSTGPLPDCSRAGLLRTSDPVPGDCSAA